MEFPSPTINKIHNGRADFRINEFRKMMAQKGHNLTWTQVGECPCSPKSTNLGLDLSGVRDSNFGFGFAPECPTCMGKGLIYHSPQTVKGIVTDAEDSYTNALFGAFRDAVVSISLLPEHLPTFGDRFALQDSVMLFRETVPVTDGNDLSLRFPIATRTLTLATGQDSFTVIYGHKTDNTTGLALGELTIETDFTVVDGKIRWVTAPPVGTRVSFTYFINQTYTVISYPHSIRDTRTKVKSTTDSHSLLPVKVSCKLEFLEPV